MIQALLREYRNLDYLMAETLVTLHEQGTLERYEWDDSKQVEMVETPTGGGIIIENLSPKVKACEARKAD
jgi:hypothetical protein